MTQHITENSTVAVTSTTGYSLCVTFYRCICRAVCIVVLYIEAWYIESPQSRLTMARRAFPRKQINFEYHRELVQTDHCHFKWSNERQIHYYIDHCRSIGILYFLWNMHTFMVCSVLFPWFIVNSGITCSICPYPSRLLQWHWVNKNIARHTVHTIVSWPDPKQWIIVFILAIWWW